ncbi:hypothetical protein SMALA_4893 [Streptomyces malaysiensis subsp. malaysiensis]|nr:hypothetical protein SMALA_4893 [Streptomyces malaysiensis]
MARGSRVGASSDGRKAGSALIPARARRVGSCMSSTSTWLMATPPGRSERLRGSLICGTGPTPVTVCVGLFPRSRQLRHYSERYRCESGGFQKLQMLLSEGAWRHGAGVQPEPETPVWANGVDLGAFCPGGQPGRHRGRRAQDVQRADGAPVAEGPRPESGGSATDRGGPLPETGSSDHS